MADSVSETELMQAATSGNGQIPESVQRAMERARARGVSESKVQALRHLKPWKRGQSGNPDGFTKATRDVAMAARQYTADALKTLGDIMRDKKAPAVARTRAAEVLLDRGYGRAPQQVNVTHGIDGQKLEDMARAILEKREKLQAKVIDAELEESTTVGTKTQEDEAK